MFRTHKLSFWYQFLVGGNAHIIQGFESEHSYFPTFIVVFPLTACTSHVYPIYYILSMIQCTSILTPCFQSVIQSPPDCTCSAPSALIRVSVLPC